MIADTRTRRRSVSPPADALPVIGSHPPAAERIVLQDYFEDAGGKTPHYYQANAVNAAVEAIAKGQNRILLVMATGTGKTYTPSRSPRGPSGPATTRCST